MKKFAAIVLSLSLLVIACGDGDGKVTIDLNKTDSTLGNAWDSTKQNAKELGNKIENGLDSLGDDDNDTLRINRTRQNNQ